MEFSAFKKSVLLTSSAKTDVSHSGGYLSVTGSQKIRYNDILSIKQINYKAEVQQVWTLGPTYTPTASTVYKLRLGDPFKRYQGYAQQLISVAFTTPALITTIGANALAQRTYIATQLAAKINAIDSLFVTASVNGGTGALVLTDDAGYYPSPTAGGVTPRKGFTTVQVSTNADGTGFVTGDLTLTTAGQYSFGDGTDLASRVPAFYAYFGNNLIGGEINNPKTISGGDPVAGQKYNAFLISYLVLRPVPTVSDVMGYEQREFAVFVDNGKGTVTTNAAGYLAFEREMHRELFGMYKNDPKAVVEFFDNGIGGSSINVNATSLPSVNGVATGATQDINALNTGDNVFSNYLIGAATQIVPQMTNTGLNLEHDATASEGSIYDTGTFTNNPKEFVVGKHEFSTYFKASIALPTNVLSMLVGFRKKTAYNLAIANLDLLSLGWLSSNVAAQPISGTSILATVVSTSLTGVTWAAGETHTLQISVKLDGSVKYFVDGVDVTSSLANPIKTLVAGDTYIPFIYHINGNTAAATATVSEWVTVQSADFIN
jgi:hypothetical protein